MQPELAALNQRLRAARLALGARRGMTVKQSEMVSMLAPYLPSPMNQVRLSRLESGSAIPTIRETLAIAVVAGVSFTWLTLGVEVRLADGASPPEELERLLAAEAEALRLLIRRGD